MTEISKAWVWESYQGVIQDGRDKGSVKRPAVDPVVPFPTAKNFRSEIMGQNAAATRAKFGLGVASSVIIGAFFPLIALPVFFVAVLLVISGKEPQKTERYLAGVPGGEYSQQSAGPL